MIEYAVKQTNICYIIENTKMVCRMQFDSRYSIHLSQNAIVALTTIFREVTTQ